MGFRGDCMKHNMSKTDRTVRFIIGFVVLILAFLTKAWWLLIISLIALVTAKIGFCGLYHPLKINTAKGK